MSLTREVTVWCDDCSAWEQSTDSAKSLRKKLRAKGWATVRVAGEGVRDYCPRCAERLEEKEEPCDSTKS